MSVNIPTTGPTLIVLTPVSPATAPTLTPYSARGATQTLDLIQGAQQGAALGTTIMRDVNGNLMDMTSPQFRKFQSVISCRDSEVPGLDAGWLGTKVTVACGAELSYPVGGSPSRTPVSGSSRTESGFVYYRPIINAMVCDVKSSFDEYACRYAWSITLQEV